MDHSSASSVSADSQSVQRSASSTLGGTVGTEYEVSAVYGKREVTTLYGPHTEYLIRWRDFPGKDSWEEAELLNCPELLEEFERKLKVHVSYIRELHLPHEFVLVPWTAELAKGELL